MERLDLEFYYGQEADQFTFYRLPKALIVDARFKDISNNAKLLYGLCLTVCLYQQGVDGLMKRIECLSSMRLQALWKTLTAVR